MASTLYFKPTIPISISSFHQSSFVSSPPFSLKPSNNSHLFGTTTSRIQNHQISTPPLSRRLFFPSVSGLWDALTGGDPGREAIAAVRRGMVLFRQGDILGSLAEFDKAIELDPRRKACLRKGRSNFGLMLHKIQMIQKSQYGAFSAKLNYMELAKQGDDFLRLVEIHDLSCGKLITCLKMVVIQKSWCHPCYSTNLFIPKLRKSRKSESLQQSLPITVHSSKNHVFFLHSA